MLSAPQRIAGEGSAALRVAAAHGDQRLCSNMVCPLLNLKGWAMVTKPAAWAREMGRSLCLALVPGPKRQGEGYEAGGAGWGVRMKQACRCSCDLHAKP